MDDLIRTALLIDADNVNVEVVEEVLRRLNDGSRRLQHRRAYGSLQKANEYAALCQQHAIRFVPTTYAGTNGTDVALAIDAVELAINEPFDEVALVTSDCDFLPLAARLRELGYRVLGYGQAGKTSPEGGVDYTLVYDEFSVIGLAAKPRAVPRRTAARSTESSSAADERPAKISMLLDEVVRKILDVLPELRDGKKVELSTAATALRAEKLLARNAPSPKLFSKYPNLFELTPAKQPNKVRYLGPR